MGRAHRLQLRGARSQAPRWGSADASKPPHHLPTRRGDPPPRHSLPPPLRAPVRGPRDEPNMAEAANGTSTNGMQSSRSCGSSISSAAFAIPGALAPWRTRSNPTLPGWARWPLCRCVPKRGRRRFSERRRHCGHATSDTRTPPQAHGSDLDEVHERSGSRWSARRVQSVEEVAHHHHHHHPAARPTTLGTTGVCLCGRRSGQEQATLLNHRSKSTPAPPPRMAQRCRRSGQSWSNLGQTWPSPGQCRSTGPESVEFGSMLPESRHLGKCLSNWAALAPNWAKLVNFSPKHAGIGPSLVDAEPTWQVWGRTCPKCGPNLSDVDQRRSVSERNAGGGDEIIKSMAQTKYSKLRGSLDTRPEHYPIFILKYARELMQSHVHS